MCCKLQLLLFAVKNVAVIPGAVTCVSATARPSWGFLSAVWQLLQITDSGTLATRLLEAVLNAGLGVSEFDEMLSDEIASVASDDDVSASGAYPAQSTCSSGSG